MKHHLRPPELKLTTLFGLAIFLCGCSSSYSVSSTGKPNSEYGYQEMNEELKGRDVNIKLKDGRDMSATEVRISNDSVSWIDQRTNEESKASNGELNKLVIRNHMLGGFEGLGIGLVGGGGLGALLGNAFTSSATSRVLDQVLGRPSV